MDINRNVYRKPILLDKTTKVWTATQSDDAKTLKCPSDCTFIRENTLVVSDSEGHSLLVYNIHDNETDYTGHAHYSSQPRVVCKDSIWPNCIAEYNDSKIVVTDRKTHTVKCIDVNTGQVVVSWTRRHMERPAGVAVTSRGLVVVTDTGTHTVNVLSPEGHLLVRRGGLGSGVQQLNLPFYCATDAKDNIIVADNMNYCLKIFDSDGHFKQRIGSGVDWGRRQFLCPYGVATDGLGNILAADSENNKVFLFDSLGRFLKHVLVRADVEAPCGLAVGLGGHIAVTEAAAGGHAEVKAFKAYEMPTLVSSPVWQKQTIAW